MSQDQTAVLKQIKNYMAGHYSITSSKKKSIQQSSSFLQHQQQYSSIRKNKIQNLKRQRQIQIQRQLTYRPKINSSSVNSHRKGVFQRLTQHKKKISYHVESQQTFRPCILKRSKKLVREGNTNELLYQDAIKRNSRSESKGTVANSQNEKGVSKNNKFYANKRILRSFFQIIQQLEIDQQISIQNLLKILQYLGYIPATLTHQFASLIQNLYQMISSQTTKTQSLMNFIFAIQATNDLLPFQYQFQIQSIGYFQQGVWLCTLQQSSLLRHLYRPFIYNRMHSARKEIQNHQYDNYKPQILQKSKHLAKKNALQLGLIDQGAILSRQDMLILTAKIKQTQLQIKKAQIDIKQLNQCTFQPNIQKTKESPDWNILSQINFKPIIKPKQTNKNNEFYSFRPKINPAPKSTPKKPPSQWQLLHLQRVQKGREQRNKNVQFRNYPEQLQTKCKNKIFVSVRINQTDQQQLVFESGQCLQQVVNNFAKQHKLNTTRQMKLLNLLQSKFNKN